MVDFVLNLGGVDFQEFEVPQEISAGGKQALSTHKYPGGIRTVDTSGPDDDQLAWSGSFLDGDAEIRCQQIDTMRRQGLAIDLVWSTYAYSVVIASFTWKYKRFYQIDYSISLEVVQDQTQPSDPSQPDVEGQMQSDIGGALSDAQGFVRGISSGLRDAVQAVQNVVGTVNSITGGSIGFLTDLQNKVGQASNIAQGVLADADKAMTAAGAAANFAAGLDPKIIIANVGNLVIESAALPLAFDAANKLSRLGKNVAAVIG